MKTIFILNAVSFLGLVFLRKLEWKFPFQLSLMVYTATLYGILYRYYG